MKQYVTSVPKIDPRVALPELMLHSSIILRSVESPIKMISTVVEWLGKAIPANHGMLSASKQMSRLVVLFLLVELINCHVFSMRNFGDTYGTQVPGLVPTLHVAFETAKKKIMVVVP